MTYRLVSRGLQDRLDEISGGDFTRRFNAMTSTEHDAFSCPRVINFELKHSTRILISIEITPDMVERAYDPHGWNEYPEVTPPKGVWMRCEFTTAEGELLRFCAKHDVCWFDRNWEKVCVRRFRPWEEEE